MTSPTGFLTSRMMLSAAVLLPLPDSPTSAIADPAFTNRSMPRTAGTSSCPA